MKGLDTNVLVRYLTQDDPKQAAMATKVIEEAAAKEEKMFLHPLVFCEPYGFCKALTAFQKRIF